MKTSSKGDGWSSSEDSDDSDDSDGDTGSKRQPLPAALPTSARGDDARVLSEALEYALRPLTARQLIEVRVKLEGVDRGCVNSITKDDGATAESLLASIKLDASRRGHTANRWMSIVGSLIDYDILEPLQNALCSLKGEPLPADSDSADKDISFEAHKRARGLLDSDDDRGGDDDDDGGGDNILLSESDDDDNVQPAPRKKTASLSFDEWDDEGDEG